MIRAKKKKNLTAAFLSFTLLLAVLAVIWFEYYGPHGANDEAWALSADQDCQTQYDKAAWSQEWLPPEKNFGDYVVYRYNYASCPYKNNSQREKFLTYGANGNLAAAGNLGIIGGKLALNKQLDDLSYKTFYLDSYASSTDFDANFISNLPVSADDDNGLSVISDKINLLTMYGGRQLNDLNLKLNLPVEAKSSAAGGITNKINGSQSRWVAGAGPYVGHCLIKKSEAGGPACEAENCPGACPAINCETISPSQCKTDRWTWEESCDYYAPVMDQFQFIKTGEQHYECGQEEFGCYGSGIYNCGQAKNCGTCWKFVSQTCTKILGYNKCLSSKCIMQKQDCRVGRALLGQPE